MKTSAQDVKREHFRLLDQEWEQLLDSATGLVRADLVEALDCPVCSSKKLSVAIVKRGFKFSKCQDCSHMFINPQLKQSVLDQHFKTSPAWEVWGKHVLLSPEQLSFDRKKYLDAISQFSEWINSESSSVSVLDVGCSSGVFLSLCKENGWECSGVEPSAESAAFANRNFGVNVYNGTMDEFTTDKKYDLITFWANLEYNKNPRAVIEKAIQFLNPNGVLYFLISGGSHSLVMRALHEDCVGLIFNRCHAFTPKSLDVLLGSQGFKPFYKDSILPDMPTLLKYLNYTNPYGDAEENWLSSEDQDILKSLIQRNQMGYKFMSAYRKGPA